MGGNALKNVQRISKNEYEQYYSEIITIFSDYTIERVQSYYDKPDFGDIDFVVKTIPGIDLKEIILERFKPSEYYDNGDTISINYKNSQIDFIFQSDQTYQTTLNYFAWNDLGNFIGRVARSMNFKYGHDGLSYQVHLDDHFKLTVPLSSDIQKILEFLGYDYNIWKQGFKTKKDIFEFAISSQYFNSHYFSLENQAHNDRVRNKKRKMYQAFLQFVFNEEKKDQSWSGRLLNKGAATEEFKNFSYQRAIDFFGIDFTIVVNNKKEDYRKLQDFKLLFNGEIVSERTGLMGKDLGKFIGTIKSKYPNLRDDVLNKGREFVYEVIDKEFH